MSYSPIVLLALPSCWWSSVCLSAQSRRELFGCVAIRRCLATPLLAVLQSSGRCVCEQRLASVAAKIYGRILAFLLDLSTRIHVLACVGRLGSAVVESGIGVSR